MLQIPTPNTEERETPAIATRMARFLVTYDYSKAPSGGIARLQKHHAEGIRFSSGKIAVDFENGNGAGYPNMKAMEIALTKQGKFDLDWID